MADETGKFYDPDLAKWLNRTYREHGDGSYSPIITSSGRKNKVQVTLTRPANTTAYAAKDVIGQAALSVSGATNASPIVMTTGTHGLADGDVVTQASVGGNTAANGTFFVKVTGYSTTTYALYLNRAFTMLTTGDGEYTSGGTVQKLIRLPNLVRINGGSAYIVKARLMASLQTFLDQIKAHIFYAPVDAIADNSPYTSLIANWPYEVGALEFLALATEGSGSNCSEAILTPGIGNVPMEIQAASDTRDFYVRFEDLGSGTPASGMLLKLELSVEED